MDETVNILLVDDEQRNLDALEVILDDTGYRLLRADDADKALRHLLENDVAAIVLDIKMPGVSGFELAQMIKGTKRFRQIPIVFLTAYLIDAEDVLAGYGVGAVDYLTKPVNPQILRHKIGVFAELFRKTRALAELNETLELRVAERTQALQQAGEEKDAFIATLAHELRNPLAPLRMGLDLLLSRGERSDSDTRALAAMNRQLDHMVRLIDDLLDVSRISRGMMELKRERVDLRTTIESAIENARPYLKKHEQVLTLEAEPVFAAVDPTRVCQIVSNLLNNAAKFSAPRQRIQVALERDGDEAVIRVTDSGAGIPKHQLERVFDMFARIERTTQLSSGGLGIGLALARRLAELHGGSLSVASEGEDQGASFTLRLPAHDDQGAAPDVTEPSTKPSLIGKLTVVVIEDNEDAADTLVLWLKEMGHEVQLARTGPEGVELVRRTRPDVVLCDIGLPGMDGVAVCAQVKQIPMSQPVMVALTGWGMEADRRRTKNAGFDHHLVKPVAPDNLRQIMESVRAS